MNSGNSLEAERDENTITPHLPVISRVLGCEENVYFQRWNSRTYPPI